MTRLSSDASDAVALPDKPWVKFGPEDRLGIATDRLLSRALERPCYFTQINDADSGGRTNNQRSRDQNRGVKGGQLDYDVVQGHPTLAYKLELKRGKNTLSPMQEDTVTTLIECGVCPVVAWTLREVYSGLKDRGFRFTANVETVLTLLEQHLAAWDREAELVKSGAVVKKRSYAPRKVKPSPKHLRMVAQGRWG